MTSIRYSILGALRDRLATISGWNAQLRGEVNTGTHPVTAIVVFLGEDKVIGTTGYARGTMTVAVEITGRIADADDTYGNDPYAYLDHLVTLAERKVYAPDSWGIDPGFTDVRIDGHDVADPPERDEFTDVQALLRLTFMYQHQYQDPEAA